MKLKVRSGKKLLSRKFRSGISYSSEEKRGIFIIPPSSSDFQVVSRSLPLIPTTHFISPFFPIVRIYTE